MREGKKERKKEGGREGGRETSIHSNYILSSICTDLLRRTDV